MDTWTIFFSSLFLILSIGYFWLKKHNRFFINRGLTNGLKPCLIFGNSYGMFMGREHFCDFVLNTYDYYKKNGGFGGVFGFLTPGLFISDINLLKTITIKEFDHFSDHFLFSSTENNDTIAAKNLFGLKGQKWKNLRSTLSPAFTANKLKILFPLINKCGKRINNSLIDKHQENFIEKSSDVLTLEAKDLFTRFANDAIASAAFGIEVDSLKFPNNEFYLMGKDLTNFTSGFRIAKFIILQISSTLFNLIWPKGIFHGKGFNYLINIVKETIEKRRKEGIVRHDMIHILLEAKEKARKQKDQLEKESEFKLGEIVELTDDDITGQCVQFFFAGFDTIATSLSLCVNQLAEFPKVQEKLRNEIDEYSEMLKDDQDIDYDFIRNLKYLDCVLTESLRRFPPLAQMDRKCTKQLKIPATDKHPEYTIQPGDQVLLPYLGFQRDPEYFPDPNNFIPERFINDGQKQAIDSLINLPFGLGPRMCIANRYARMECKIVLYHILKNFEIVPVEGSSIPLQLTKKSFDVRPDNGFIIGFKKRQNASKYIL